MPDNEPSSKTASSTGAATSPKNGGDAPVVRTYWQRARLAALRLAAVLGALALIVALMTGGAAQYTSRSEFCSSCHIMEPYYASWQESTHHDVACIKCHFPPGAAEKVRGKMLGLVQLLKYVTQTASPRPAAEIPDESCLRCHDTRLLSGRVEFQGVPFDHRPHLGDLRHGTQLHCTSCHSQIVQGQHMTVTTSTCFLCHFKDGVLNQALGACTRCHQIPEDTFDLGGGVKFTHELAYERGVDCANCHSDLIRGNGEVPVQRCTVCHNRPADLKRIDDYEFIHQMHVSEHKVDCFDCHTEIQHALDPHKIEHAASDCRSCHPNQHGEQIRLLRGEGGKSISAEPRGMGIARIACPSCHQVKETSVTGTVLWRASTAVCTQCHDEAATERLLTRHGQLKDTMADIEAGLSRAREALTAATLDEKQKTEFTQQLRDLGDDLQFVRVGNSIHNMHYADSLVQALVNNLRAVSRDLDIAEPTIHLPEKLD